MYCQHLESLRKKLISCVTSLRWLASSGWGAAARALQIATLTLVRSTTEYCAPVWCRSAHTCLIDPNINGILWIVARCLHPVPVGNLPILAGIQPAELHRKGATLSLECHGAWTPAPLSAYPSIECKCTAPQIETPIYAHCTTTMGRSPMEYGVGGQPYKTLHFHPQFCHPHPWNHPPKNCVCSA